MGAAEARRICLETTMKPRDYQQYGVDCIWRYFAEGGTGNPIVAMPTGTGKSVVIAQFLIEAFRQFPQTRCMLLSHVKEILQQDMTWLLRLWPTAPVGVYSAGLGRKEDYAPITVAGIGSVADCAQAFGFIDFVIVDECHLVSPKEDTMYQAFLRDLRTVNPKLKVIGYTATHYRLGQGDLVDGGLFTDVAVDMTELATFNWFVDEGYLCPLIARPTSTELQVDGVQIRQGEYNQKQLQGAVDKAEVTRAALAEAVRLGGNRSHWLGFASGVEHAEHCAAYCNELGVKATVVHSKMTDAERDARLTAYCAGEFTACWNNGVLTTGFDFPLIDLMLVLRPTMSPGLHVQMLGRGTRAVYAPGFDVSTTRGRLDGVRASQKPNCLVLDFAGNVRRLGPINDPVTPKKKGKGQGEAPVKVCESCGNYVHASARVCPICLAQFQIKVRFKARATEDEILKRDEAPEIIAMPVDRVTYHVHAKAGSHETLKASYHCGLRIFHEWLCFEHEGYPKHKAHVWWREHASTPPPRTVVEAAQRLTELRTPKAVQVWINKQYPEVRGHGF
jgi:DNA repair protein RadD